MFKKNPQPWSLFYGIKAVLPENLLSYKGLLKGAQANG